MTIQEENEMRAKALLGVINNGLLDAGAIENFTYHHLASIKWVYNIDLFKTVSNKIYDLNIKKIKGKSKIKIAFLNNYASTWACTRLYKMLEEDDRFEPYILVVPFYNGTEITIMDTYKKTSEYFREHGYKTIMGYDVVNKRHLEWSEIDVPDIIIHQHPHYKGIRDTFYFYNIPLSVLNIYIPYAFMANNDYALQYNQMSHLLYWKIFCETTAQKKLFEDYCDIGDAHVIVSGYAKMDTLLDNTPVKSAEKIWKMPPNIKADNIVKIIYAPHHSLYSGLFGYATFDKNYMDIYQLACKYADSTSWIIKPHPLLRKQAVVEGLFQNEQEFDNYIAMWDNLPNARSVGDEPYFDIFKSSDGMIFDSQSFRTEYIYVNKPSLYLKRRGHNYEMSFDRIGLEVLDILYSVEGDDIDGIENFIQDVLLSKNDYKRKGRENFYKNYLDYYTYNGGKLANDVIYDFLKANLAKE